MENEIKKIIEIQGPSKFIFHIPFRSKLPEDVFHQNEEINQKWEHLGQYRHDTGTVFLVILKTPAEYN